MIFIDFYPPSVGSSCELSFHPILGLDLWFAFRVQFCCHGTTDVCENVCCEGTICSAYPFLEVFYPYFLGWAESPTIIEYIPVGHGLSLYGSYIANIPQSVSDQVGLLYAVQNLLYFACLQYTSAAAYQVMSSSESVM